MGVDFTPQVGDQVEVFGHPGRFAIGKREVVDGHYRFKLERQGDGSTLEDVPYPMISFPPEERVRQVLSQVIAECGPWPEDFQQGRFEVKFKEMYDGTPQVMVYFQLRPEAVPSVVKARIWSDFYAKLREKLELFTGTWVQFTAREERSTLRVAS